MICIVYKHYHVGNEKCILNDILKLFPLGFILGFIYFQIKLNIFEIINLL